MPCLQKPDEESLRGKNRHIPAVIFSICQQLEIFANCTGEGCGGQRYWRHGCALPPLARHRADQGGGWRIPCPPSLLPIHHRSLSSPFHAHLAVPPPRPTWKADPHPTSADPRAEQPKVLSAVEDRMDELGASIAQSRRTVALIKSAAATERERVSQMFAEATSTLQNFQTEVLGFIEEGEATLLGRSQGDLRRQEEQRSRLSRARHNLSQVPEADSVSFLQELLALRLALEEGCGPGPGPPRELSFTKSSQVVRALRDILVSACASQWEQLRGLGSDEDELQKLGSEAEVESQDPDSTNLLESEAPRDYFLKFAYIVDLDSDTADKFLQLFGTKGVKRVLCPINYPESPTRFTHCEQVLGEGALDRGTYYWEVEIIEGWVSVGVMAEGFSPQEPYDRGRLGRNAHSCCLQWNGRGFSVWFCGLEAPLPHAFSPTVGVCLEYADHALAFYAVRDGKLSLLRRLKASRPRRSGALASPTDPFQSRLDSHFSGLFNHRLKPAFFLESVDAHLQIGPLKKSCISVLKRR
ncbi:E3 ubiquitin-protein ligase TRIM47 isoform X1 [Cricetulus griseus]|uniref:E3 ubiquitin-protein ligase TRIM47 isoform X1 n=1 Tax=Cricetulus griseus TaxID=10029 RepID=UPI0007DA937B|nr:E3 ubiquitin-protein ligase TRIM47 isoform X1 [Cricetulus griseus]